MGQEYKGSNVWKIFILTLSKRYLLMPSTHLKKSISIYRRVTSSDNCINDLNNKATFHKHVSPGKEVTKRTRKTQTFQRKVCHWPKFNLLSDDMQRTRKGRLQTFDVEERHWPRITHAFHTSYQCPYDLMQVA